MSDMAYERYMQHVVDKLLSTDYEFLGLLNVVTGYLMVFGINKDVEGMARNGSFYDEEMPRVFKALILEEYFDEGVRTMARTHVIEELERKESYICSFPARSFGCTSAGRKQWKFSYLNDSKTQILMTRTDITEMFTAERDALTGLYNRQAFYRRVRELLDEKPGEKFVLARCDLDRFKTYNDACGTQAGDRLLAEFGRAVRRAMWPDSVTFGRLEADHFCALFPVGDLDMDRWSRMQAQWLDSITQGYRLTSSVGFYEITDPGIDVSLMCDRARLALDTVKDSYTSKIAWYDDALRRRLMGEQALVDEMETALEEEQFVLYFQPQVNYVDGSLVGAEALVRWQHPKRGLILPNEFIPLFEKNGFILKLDAYVWEKSCQYLRTWLDQTDGNMHLSLSVSVNISRYDIYDPELCEKLHRLVEKYRVPPAQLKLEITESAYMENPEQLIEVVNGLRGLGFTVEMDDFGSGYSSLNTLKDVPVDVLKLDIRFLSGGENDARGGLILYSIIRMAHWLKIPVIAEGVETAALADYLKSLSCFYMQGFYFGRPMPAPAFEEFILRKGTEKMNRYDDVSLGAAEALWNPEDQMSLIFNQFLDGAAIMEYCSGKAEIVRANDRFYKELGTTRAAYLEKQRDTLSRFDEEQRAVYIAMLEQAVQTGQQAECENWSLPLSGGKRMWFHNRVRLLAQLGDLYLIFLSVSNITKRKALEEQLEENERARKALEKQLEAVSRDCTLKDGAEDAEKLSEMLK